MPYENNNGHPLLLVDLAEHIVPVPAQQPDRSAELMLWQFIVGSLAGFASGPLLVYLGVWPIPQDLSEWCHPDYFKDPANARWVYAYTTTIAVAAAGGVPPLHIVALPLLAALLATLGYNAGSRN
jgi:hypothetical protein